jgi:S-methylmethionine-dependent homocysteine/selenocysteine methylase
MAVQARDEVNPDALVLGCVAPLEQCYDPTLSPDAATCTNEHRKTMKHLLDAGVDFLLIET